jgi:outer membrane protein TolC
MISKHIYPLLALAFLSAVNCQLSTAYAQQHVVLDLDRTVRLATDSSLSAQRYQSVYDISRYQYLSWQASRKPQFTLESTPVSYERYMTRRYLSNEDIDVYRQQRVLYSQAGISATQTMESWGGYFYGSTQLGYLRTLGDQNQTQFMTIPISVGYKQDLLFYNPLKWARQIEPLKLARAEKELAYNIETTSELAVEKFFALALAQDDQRMAEEYLASCDTIYAIAERRYKIASIPKADLRVLELEKINAQTALTNARIARQRAAQELASYLCMDRSTDIELVIPTIVQNLRVDAAEAIQNARENNPKYLESRQATAEARRDAEKARVEKNLNLSFNASIGLNQVADRFVDAFSHLLSQDMATLTLSLPLKDWGKRKNAYLAARSTVEAAERAEQEVARDTELDVTLTVNDFNERQAVVETSRQALTIAEDAYAQVLQLFIRAQADAYDLSLAQSHWQSARQNQIASLQNYWLAYYHLRRLTLYDYQRHQVIRHGKQ